MLSDDAVEDGARLARNCLFTLVLKTFKLYLSGNTLAGRVFQFLAVCIRNEEPNRFVRLGDKHIDTFTKTIIFFPQNFHFIPQNVKIFTPYSSTNLSTLSFLTALLHSTLQFSNPVRTNASIFCKHLWMKGALRWRQLIIACANRWESTSWRAIQSCG